jgi:urease accessory protein
MRKSLIAIIGILLFLPETAYAHVVQGGGGFISGLTHPVLGVDHLLAMLSVGILSAQMGGKSIWRVPAIFVIVMLVGGILGIKGVHIDYVELGIIFSVLALGLAIASERNLPAFLAMILVGIFAIFHGHAHGSEMPHLAKPALYACGFVVGTAIIHVAGLLIGFIVKSFRHGSQLLRYLGASIAGIGFYMIVM